MDSLDGALPMGESSDILDKLHEFALRPVAELPQQGHLLDRSDHLD
jgi:hypothetical protein